MKFTSNSQIHFFFSKEILHLFSGVVRIALQINRLIKLEEKGENIYYVLLSMSNAACPNANAIFWRKCICTNKLKKKKKQIPKQTKMVYMNKCQCLTVKVQTHLSLFREFLIAKFSQDCKSTRLGKLCTDFATGSSWSCEFAMLTNRKLLGSKMTSVSFLPALPFLFTLIRLAIFIRQIITSPKYNLM